MELVARGDHPVSEKDRNEKIREILKAKGHGDKESVSDTTIRRAVGHVEKQTTSGGPITT